MMTRDPRVCRVYANTYDSTAAGIYRDASLTLLQIECHNIDYWTILSTLLKCEYTNFSSRFSL